MAEISDKEPYIEILDDGRPLRLPLREIDGMQVYTDTGIADAATREPKSIGAVEQFRKKLLERCAHVGRESGYRLKPGDVTVEYTHDDAGTAHLILRAKGTTPPVVRQMCSGETHITGIFSLTEEGENLIDPFDDAEESRMALRDLTPGKDLVLDLSGTAENVEAFCSHTVAMITEENRKSRQGRVHS